MSRWGGKFRHSKSVKDYIINRILIGKEDECWPWKGHKDRDGYGRCIGCLWYRQYKKSGAHQLAYIAFVGEIPIDKCVCHACDNPSCCNPKHLFLGSFLENNLDKIKKKRHNAVKGEKNHHSKLTLEKVLEIRKLKGIKNCLKIAKEYNISFGNVCVIWRNETWQE